MQFDLGKNWGHIYITVVWVNVAVTWADLPCKNVAASMRINQLWWPDMNFKCISCSSISIKYMWSFSSAEWCLILESKKDCPFNILSHSPRYLNHILGLSLWYIWYSKISKCLELWLTSPCQFSLLVMLVAMKQTANTVGRAFLH